MGSPLYMPSNVYGWGITFVQEVGLMFNYQRPSPLLLQKYNCPRMEALMASSNFVRKQFRFFDFGQILNRLNPDL